ncbi:MAG: transketolase [Lachnospiraceae bacterium]|jgi:transketolase|nr:transketolase [Lachnospiraceae bacterium]
MEKMLEEIAKEIRKDIMITAYHGKSGHLASAFSAVEIMTALYFGGIVKYDKNHPDWEDRDKVIVSKGHASLVLYSVIKRIGYITPEQLYSFCQPGSLLGGEAKYGDIPGVEATTGSLGHGLPFAVGIALANRLDARESHTYVLLGDGECQEGSVWEAALSAAHYRLGNLTVILDRNKLQAMGDTEEILKLDSLGEKWSSFGWDVKNVDGHDIGELARVLEKDRNEAREQPRIIIADTVKGRGVSFMEHVPIWHYRMPNTQEMEIVKRELGITERELQG